MAKRIIIKPIITEKADKVSEDLGKYSFVVAKDANKIEIRKAVEAMYNVSVESVNTMVVPGKSKRRNTKSGVLMGKTPSYKKAVVSVADGEIIDFYEDI